MKLKILSIAILVAAFSIQLNAQDIIVLNNGDLIKSHVREIGLAVIKYQRADQATGPIYSLEKSEIFAIHYEDGTKDMFSKGQVTVSNINKKLEDIFIDTVPVKEVEETFMKRDMVFHGGLCLQRIHSPINEIGINDHKMNAIHWNVNAGIGITTNTVFGVGISKGAYSTQKTFTDETNFTSTTFDVNFSITSFTAWGRYYIKTKQDYFRPYAAYGLTFNSSNASSIIKVETESDIVSIDRGGKIKDMTPVLKLGVEFDALSYLVVYAEAGYDITLVSIGIGYRIDRR